MLFLKNEKGIWGQLKQKRQGNQSDSYIFLFRFDYSVQFSPFGKDVFLKREIFMPFL